MRLLPLAAVLLLLGCQYRGDNQVPAYPDAAAVAEAAGCTGFHPILPDPFAADAGDCTYRSRPMSVEWFNDPGAMARWQGLPSGRPVVVGANWAVKCVPRDCAVLRRELGGFVGKLPPDVQASEDAGCCTDA